MLRIGEILGTCPIRLEDKSESEVTAMSVCVWHVSYEGIYVKGWFCHVNGDPNHWQVFTKPITR